MDHYKSWSGLNKWLNECLCEELKGRITYFLTRYHKVHILFLAAVCRNGCHAYGETAGGAVICQSNNSVATVVKHQAATIVSAQLSGWKFWKTSTVTL